MDEHFMKERPVLPLLISMSLPMVISMLVNSLYNIVDSFFVAKISEDALTALSLVFPMQNLINSIAIGFGVGLNAVISIHLGAENKLAANKAATLGLALSILHGLLITALSLCVMPAFLRLFNPEEAVVELGLRYAGIAFLFSLVIMLNLCFEKLFQAEGRMQVSMLGLLCGGVTNLILDPLLIFGIGFFPAMGIEGAALATGIGQLLSLVFYLCVHKCRPLSIQLSWAFLKPDSRIICRLYAVGIPATLNMALPSLLVSCLNALLGLYAQSYVVVLGIYYKLQTFLYLPANGIIQGMRPLVGYNYGAGENGRVRSIYTASLCLCGLIMAFGTLLCLSCSGPIIGLFSNVPETIAAGKTALRIISAGFIISSVSVTSSGALEGLGKGGQSLVISLCRYVLVILPAAYILCRLFGPVGVWNAFWVTEVITALVSLTVYRRAVKKPL